jgi:hypothetical protein
VVEQARADSAGDRLRRNLVIVRAGDDSVHEGWLRGGARSFDLIVSYYGDDPLRFRNDDALRIDQKGGKFDGLHSLFTQQPDLFRNYDHIWLADDDIVTQSETIDRLFAVMAEHDFLVAQPALSWNSHFAYPVTLNFPHCHLRYSNFVEAMVPCFRADYLRRVWPIFDGFRFGWGMGVVWTRLMPEPLGRAAIVDACVVRHTRRMYSGSLYQEPGHGAGGAVQALRTSADASLRCLCGGV